MDTIVKKKVLEWISSKITLGDTYFVIDDCMDDIGLNPLDRKEYHCVQEVFDWHQTMINSFYDICFEENT